MTLEADLLKLARRLGALEKSKPRQSSLRRAVSTAYYSVFHLLIQESAQQMAPATPANLREQVTRAFDHSTMRQVCVAFSGTSQIPKSIQGLLNEPIEPELKSLAKLFVDLQTQRHDADYNVNAKFTRLEVLALIRRARRTVGDWKNGEKSGNRKVFLTALLLNRLWRA